MNTSIRQNERIPSIDRLRGIVMFCLLFFESARKFDSLGILTRVASHSMEQGIHVLPSLVVADVGTALFFMLIAFNFIPSFRRRSERDGKRAAYAHFVFRNLCFIGFGCCMIAIEDTFNGNYSPESNICALGAAAVIALGLIYLVSILFKKKEFGKKVLRIFLWVLAILGAINIVVGFIDCYKNFWIDDHSTFWGALQGIGGAGLVMLLFAEASTGIRAFAAGLIFAVFTFIHQTPGYMEIIDWEVQGGIVGTLGWGSMMIAFSVLADMFYSDRSAKADGKRGWAVSKYAVTTLIFAVVGAAGYILLPCNKGSVSPGYVLVCLPICAVCFWVIKSFDNWSPRFKLFTWWGTSPIIMYLLKYLLVDVIVSVIGGLDEMSWVPSLIFVFAVTAIITLIARKLYSSKNLVHI